MSPTHPIPGSPAEWLAFARGDLAIAKIPLPPGVTYGILCFHAQQAAEKAIKAVYRLYNQPFRYTHDLNDLLDGLAGLGVEIPESMWELSDLTRFAWESRYPGLGEPISEDEYQQAVTLAEMAVAWAARLIESAR